MSEKDQNHPQLFDLYPYTLAGSRLPEVHPDPDRSQLEIVASAAGELAVDPEDVSVPDN